MNSPAVGVVSGFRYRQRFLRSLFAWFGLRVAVLAASAALSAPATLSTTPSTQPVLTGRDTPAGAMNVLVHALETGDTVTIADFYASPDDKDGSYRRARAAVLLADMRVFAAATARFGPEAAAKIISADGIPPRKYLPNEFRVQPGDPNDVDASDPKPGIWLSSMHRSADGIWRYSFPFGITNREIAQYLVTASDEVPRLDGITEKIKAGDYPTLHDLVDDLWPGPKKVIEANEKMIKDYEEQLAKAKLGRKTVGGAIDDYLLAVNEKDSAEIAKFFYAEGDDDGKFAAANANRVLLINQLAQAISDKMELGSEDLMRLFGLSSVNYTPFEIGEAVEHGDVATGTLPDGRTKLIFRRVNGFWKIDITPDPSSDLGKQTEGMNGDNQKIEKITIDVVAGKYKNIGQVRDAFVAANLAATPDPDFKANNYKLQGK